MLAARRAPRRPRSAPVPVYRESTAARDGRSTIATRKAFRSASSSLTTGRRHIALLGLCRDQQRPAVFQPRQLRQPQIGRCRDLRIAEPSSKLSADVVCRAMDQLHKQRRQNGILMVNPSFQQNFLIGTFERPQVP